MNKGITFENDKGEKYHIEVDKVNPYLISAGSPKRIEKISKHLDNSKIYEGSRKLTIVNGEYKNTPITAFTTGMGPASVSIVLPEIIELGKGDLTILRIGTAGTLQSNIKKGDIVISMGTVRDENTTTALIGKEYPSISNFELLPIIIHNSIKQNYKLGENLWKGIHHVKDDLYFKEFPDSSPSKEKIKQKLESYKRMGVSATSMEFSVYTILRDYYNMKREGNISVGCLLGIIANPIIEKTSEDINKNFKSQMEKDLTKIGLNTLNTVYNIKNNKEINIKWEKIIKQLLNYQK
ncbi:MAG: hypothetical protein ACOCP8_10140 [archaeon]